METTTRSSSSYLATHPGSKSPSNLLTLASTQLGNTLRIENTGSTSWKPLRSSLGLARDDDDMNPFNEPVLRCDRSDFLLLTSLHWKDLLFVPFFSVAQSVVAVVRITSSEFALISERVKQSQRGDGTVPRIKGCLLLLVGSGRSAVVQRIWRIFVFQAPAKDSAYYYSCTA